MESNLQKDSMENRELVRRSMMIAQGVPMSMLIADAGLKEEKEEVEKKLVQKNIDLLVLSFEKGYKILIAEIKNKVQDDQYTVSADLEPILVEEFQIDDETMNLLKEEISEGENPPPPLFELCDFSEDILIIFYDLGVKLYEEARYADSIDAFIFLTRLYPTMQSFWTGLGLCYEKNLEFDKAIDSFEQAIKVEPSNFSPVYGLIRCCESIKDFSKLTRILEEQKENEVIKSDVEEVLAYIKDKKIH